MATATKKEQQLDDILPDINRRYAYVLAKKNERRGKIYDENGNVRGEPPYQPQVNILFRSSIVWDGSIDPFSKNPRNKGVHQIRYYDGCTTLFVDDQPKEKDIENFIAATRQANFDHGYYFVFGYETMLKLYMDWASYNEDSPYRKPSADIKWKTLDTEKQIMEEGSVFDLEDKAIEYAKTASLKKMKLHCRYLGVSLQDPVSSIELSEKALRIEYRKAAKADPKDFVKSFDDKALEIKTWIAEAIAVGKISTTTLPNKATWAKGGGIIMDISGIKAPELIVEKLVEFSQMEEGGDFAHQLKALFD